VGAQCLAGKFERGGKDGMYRQRLGPDEKKRAFWGGIEGVM